MKERPRRSTNRGDLREALAGRRSGVARRGCDTECRWIGDGLFHDPRTGPRGRVSTGARFSDQKRPGKPCKGIRVETDSGCGSPPERRSTPLEQHPPHGIRWAFPCGFPCKPPARTLFRFSICLILLAHPTSAIWASSIFHRVLRFLLETTLFQQSCASAFLRVPLRSLSLWGNRRGNNEKQWQPPLEPPPLRPRSSTP